ncbi:MAG: DUF1836 domain-containing protein [Acholeplasmatales bacterium]|nr:DUF1836 domain-containing protein [Acholeplasmatales bacterium]
MDNIKKSLEAWLNELNNFSFKNYEELPDINLYMDQVVTFLEKQLYIFQTSTLDKQITPSMINNYVKGDVLPAPISKKYNREHIALIEEICTLKQVLTIAEVKQIEDSRYGNIVSKGDTFNTFNTLNNEKISTVVEDAFKSLNDIDDNDTSKLNELALDFALTANAYINVAKRILFLTRMYEEIQKTKKKKKKDKDTDTDVKSEE